MKKKRISKLWILPGLVCLGIGTLGVLLPFLPTVPFYIAAAFFFAKGSQRLYDWFVATKLYQNHLETFVEKKTMKLKSKIVMLSSITLVMGAGFYFMDKVPVARIVLAVIWFIHIIYFGFYVKNEKEA